MMYAVKCRECGTVIEIEAPEEGIQMWQQGMLIQKALPELSIDDREMLISRICPECWDKMFGKEE